MDQPGGPGLRRNRAWKLLWFGQAVSIVGDFVFQTTIVLWIGTVIAKGQGWAPAAVSGVLIAAAVPAIVVGPVAGVFVDRWDRRRIMLTADACRAVLVVTMLPLAWAAVASHLSSAATLAIIYVVVAAASCFGQFFNPARFAVLYAVVDHADVARASGLFQATMSMAGIVGPPLAAPLLFVFGVQWALVINAVSFAVSFATIFAIRLPASGTRKGQAPARFVSEFRDGLRFFATNKVLIALALGAVIATLGAGAINALNVFFVTHNLHVAAKWYGTMGAADGIGAVLGALAVGRIAARIGSQRIFWGGLVGCGVLLIVYSRMDMLVIAFAVLALIGVVVGALNAAISPLLLEATPQEMLGRVVAVLNPLQQIASITAMATAGILASTVLHGMHAVVAGMTFGPYDTIFGIGGLFFIAGGLAAIRPLRTPSSRVAPAAQPPADAVT